MIYRLFILLSPLVTLIFLFASGTVHPVLAVLLGVWFLSALAVMVGIVISSSFRERVLLGLTRIRERDEREERIVGRAARASFLFMLALLICLFSVSTFRYKKSLTDPSVMALQSFTIGNLDLNSAAQPVLSTKVYEGREHQMASYGFPLNGSSVFALLLIAQMASFYWFARRFGSAD